MNDFKKALAKAKIHYPDLEIKYKNKSLFMKLISYILFFNKDFNSKYITTIGNTIYFPSEDFVKNNDSSSVDILCHELVHINQSNKDKFFKVKYLFPQIFAIGSLLSFFAFINIWFLLALGFLLFLIPFNAKFRSNYEFEAYTTTMYCKYKRNNSLNTNRMIDSIVKNFTTSFYYWMDKDYVKMYSKFNKEMDLIKSNSNDLFGMKKIVDSVLGD